MVGGGVMDLRDIIIARKKADKAFEPRRNIVKCVTVGVDDPLSCAVATRNGYIWVQEYGLASAYYQVLNTGVQNIVGQPVLVGHEPHTPFRRVVLDTDWETIAPYIPDDVDIVGVSNHAMTHEWPDGVPGSDPVSIYSRAIVPFRAMAFPDTMLVYISPMVYILDGATHRFSEAWFDTLPFLPSAGYSVRILLYLDTTGSLSYLESDESVTGVQPGFPDPPEGCIACAWIYLEDTYTEIDDTDVIDGRAFFTNASSQATILASDEFRRQLSLVESELDFAISTIAVG